MPTNSKNIKDTSSESSTGKIKASRLGVISFIVVVGTGAGVLGWGLVNRK